MLSTQSSISIVVDLIVITVDVGMTGKIVELLHKIEAQQLSSQSSI